MNKISVSTRQRPDGRFDVAYRLDELQPLAAGTVTVELAARETRDRPIVAELAALQYLLCELQVCGPSRTGHGLEIEVTFGAIKRAVRHGALKATDQGKTDKSHIVPYTHFLATRFFEAEKRVVPNPAWANGCLLKYRSHTIVVNGPRESTLPTHLGEAVISRHALTRFVQRFIARDVLQAGGDDEHDDPILTTADLDAKYWTRAWKSLARLLISQNTHRFALASFNFGERMVSRPGQKTARYLHHPDSRAIFVLVPDGGRLVLATVLRDFEGNKLFRAPRTFGEMPEQA